MSLVPQDREMSSGFLGGMGILGRGTLGGSSTQGWLSGSFRLPSTFVSRAASPPELPPHLRQGVSSLCCSDRLAHEGCHRTGILGARFLVVCL